MRQCPHVPDIMHRGLWNPPKQLGHNVRKAGGSTGICFWHDGNQTIECVLPADAAPYKTVSVYYGPLSTFYTVPYDAIKYEVAPRVEDNESSSGDEEDDEDEDEDDLDAEVEEGNEQEGHGEEEGEEDEITNLADWNVLGFNYVEDG